MSNYAPKHVPTTYAGAREIIREHGKTKRHRAYPTAALGHATTLEPRGVMTQGADPLDAPSYAVRYHDTDVVTFYRNGVLALDHGGWVSTTTVRRMHLFTPRELRVSGVDILARRADADPRIVVTRVRWEITVSEWTGATYAAPVNGSEQELFTTRHRDSPTYLVEGYSPSTRRSTWALAPEAIVLSALHGK